MKPILKYEERELEIAPLGEESCVPDLLGEYPAKQSALRPSVF